MFFLSQIVLIFIFLLIIFLQKKFHLNDISLHVRMLDPYPLRMIELTVFNWHHTMSEYDTRSFYSGRQAQIETHARQVQNIFDSVGILLMGRLRQQAINLVLQASRAWGDGPRSQFSRI